MYTMHPDLAFLAIDDWVLYAGGSGTKTKLNPKKLAELEMALQVAMMIISDIYKEMRLHGTLYEPWKRAAGE